jgi:hypothetical protein
MMMCSVIKIIIVLQIIQSKAHYLFFILEMSQNQSQSSTVWNMAGSLWMTNTGEWTEASKEAELVGTWHNLFWGTDGTLVSAWNTSINIQNTFVVIYKYTFLPASNNYVHLLGHLSQTPPHQYNAKTHLILKKKSVSWSSLSFIAILQNLVKMNVCQSHWKRKEHRWSSRVWH